MFTVGIRWRTIRKTFLAPAGLFLCMCVLRRSGTVGAESTLTDSLFQDTGFPARSLLRPPYGALRAAYDDNQTVRRSNSPVAFPTWTKLTKKYIYHCYAGKSTLHIFDFFIYRRAISPTALAIQGFSFTQWKYLAGWVNGWRNNSLMFRNP